MEKTINNRMTLYATTDSPSTVLIFSHGSSGDRNTDFIKSISTGLVKSNPAAGVVTYDFDFANQGEPSEDLSVETETLNKTVKWVKDTLKPLKIILIGKSIGGVVNLKYLAEKNDSSVSLAFVLGMPFKLGFPPQLRLLKDPNPVLPAYENEYTKLFEAVKNSVVILQGDSDDLCEVKEFQDFISKYPNCKLITVEGANHGFLSATGDLNYYSECVAVIADNI